MSDRTQWLIQGRSGRGWCALGGVLLLTACSEDVVSHPAIDAANDLPMVAMDISEIGVDVASPLDAGIDVGTPMDDGRRDVVTPRDDGSRDVESDVRVDAGLPLEVPLDPMGVPAPGSECTGDGGVRPGDPSIAPPRPILPQSVSRVTSQRPSFRWALPEGTTGARVEVCADRCCTRVIQTLEAEGTTVRPTTALPPGVVYWRMFGRRAGVTGSRASYTWEFGVRRRDTPVDSSWGTIRDFTGDGYDDLVMLSGEFNVDGTTSLYVAEGGPAGPREPRVLTTVGDVPNYGRPRIGDFDGDGRADIAYEVRHSGRTSIDIVQSMRGSPPRYQRQSYSPDSNAEISSPAVVDWDGDGYSDMVTTVFLRARGTLGIVGSVLVVYRGSPSGLAIRPQELVVFPDSVTRPGVHMMVELADVDLDGFGDIFVLDQRPPSSEYGKFVLHRRSDGTMQAESFPALPGPPDVIGDVVYPVNIGDINGDGLGDLALRLRDFGAFYLYRWGSIDMMPFAAVRESPPAGGGVDFGSTIEGADLNGDGLVDLMVRSASSATESWLDTGFPYNSGRMYVYWGSRDGLLGDPIWFDRVRPTDPMDNPGAFAAWIASPGDLNADGIDDVSIVDPSRDTCCHVMGGASLVGAHLGECTPIPGRGFRVF